MEVNKFRYGPYSPSRLDVATCPARFKAEYIDKIDKGPMSGPAKRGSIVHVVLESLLKRKLKGETKFSNELIREEVANACAAYSTNDAIVVEFAYDAAINFLEHMPFDLETVFGVEEDLAVKHTDEGWVQCEFNDPECMFRGKLDILMIDDDKAIYIDHKTQPVIEEANTFQMGVYSWMLSKCYPYLESISSILYFCDPKIDYYSQPFEWTKNHIQTIENILMIRAMSVDKLEKFDEIPNFYCKYCPISSDCGVSKEYFEKGTVFGKSPANVITSAEQAMESASAVTVLDEGRSKLNKNLQKFVKEIGPVAIAGKEFSYKQYASYEAKTLGCKKVIYDIIDKNGIDPFTYFKLDSNAIKQVYKTLGADAINEIKKNLTLVKKSRFGSRKL